MRTDRKPTLSYRKAIDRMRMPETRLVQTHSPQGDAFYVVPGGYVEPDTAEKIIKHPQVVGSPDGLFPNMPQTWRIIGPNTEAVS
jgi:hypothetical protein